MRRRKVHLICRYDEVITGYLESKWRAEKTRDTLAYDARREAKERGENFMNDPMQGYHIRTIEVIDFM